MARPRPGARARSSPARRSSASPTFRCWAPALLVGCLFDAASATLREAAARGIAPHLQIQVFAHVVLVDACLAPIGFLAGHAAAATLAGVLLVLPLAGLLMLLARDRRTRIEQAQSRLQLAIRERSRLQSAVRRMGDAFAARLDIDALVDIMLRGSIEALDADTGCLRLVGEPRCACPDAPARPAPRAGRRRRGARPPAAGPSSRTTPPAGRSRSPSASAAPKACSAPWPSRAASARSRTTRWRC